MKDENLLKAVGQIDDKFIEEAMPSEKQDGVKASQKKTWRWAAGIAACLAVCIGIGSAFSGMGGSSKSTDASMGYDYAVTEECATEAEMSSDMSMSTMAMASGSTYGGAADGLVYAKEAANGGSDLAASASRFSNVKLVYTAYLNLQTTDYDESYNTITDLVSRYNGYFENISTDNGGYYSDYNYRSGFFTVRVPSDKYSEFLGAVGDCCHIVNKNESVEDIGQQYFETEARLETLRIKEERLQSLLKDATTMSDIIELESALSDTEYQIDTYSTELNRYDSLVNYSTVNINLEQVQRTTDSIEEDSSFFAKVARNFKYGLEACVDNLAGFAYWLSYNLVAILIVAAVIIFVIKFRLISKIKDKIDKRNC